MKKIILLCCTVIAIQFLTAQTTTIILVRHAEKDTSAAGSAMMQADPPLSKAGGQRAARLPEVLKAYTPDAIYSTNYTRTKATVTPLAAKFNKEIQLYDPRKQQAFADELLAMQGRTIVVAGHSNTIPALVNLLIKEKKYPDLNDAVYDKYFIVTLNNGKAEARMEEY